MPDNEEVYLDAHGFTSIIFDITERVVDPPTDTAALQYHLNDIVDHDERVTVWRSGPATCAKMP